MCTDEMLFALPEQDMDRIIKKDGKTIIPLMKAVKGMDEDSIPTFTISVNDNELLFSDNMSDLMKRIAHCSVKMPFSVENEDPTYHKEFEEYSFKLQLEANRTATVNRRGAANLLLMNSTTLLFLQELDVPVMWEFNQDNTLEIVDDIPDGYVYLGYHSDTTTLDRSVFTYMHEGVKKFACVPDMVRNNWKVLWIDKCNFESYDDAPSIVELGA